MPRVKKLLMEVCLGADMMRGNKSCVSSVRADEQIRVR